MTPGEFIAAFDVIAEAPGGVERLRALVLRLAVRGRLVPQDSGDEPASVLLERIADERMELTEKKKLRVSKPLSPVSQYEVDFEIPQSWTWARLGNLYNLEMGQSPSSQFYNQTGDGLPFYQGKADFGDRFPTVRYWCTKPTKLADEGDVLLSVRAPIGPTNIATERCCIGRGLASLRPLAGMPTEYLLWTIRAFEEQLDSLGTGTTFKAISRKQLEPFPLPLPPLAEQHRIVAEVDELMGLIDRLETAQSSREAARVAGRDSALAALRNAATPQEVGVAWTCIAERMDDLFTDPADLVPLREAVLQLAVRGRLVEQEPDDEPAGRLLELIVAEKAELVKKKKVRKRKPYGSLMSDEIPFEIPRSWTWVRLHDLAHDLGQKVPDKTFSYIDVSAIDNKRGAIISAVPILDPSEAPSRARKLVRLGAVIYSTVRPYLLNIAIVDCEYSPMPIASTAFAVLHPHSGVHSRLLFFYLRAPFFVDFVTAQMKGVAYPAINDTDLLCAPVPLPPTAEQYRIVAKVDELMGLIDQLEQHLVDKRKYHEASADAATNVV